MFALHAFVAGHGQHHITHDDDWAAGRGARQRCLPGPGARRALAAHGRRAGQGQGRHADLLAARVMERHCGRSPFLSSAVSVTLLSFGWQAQRPPLRLFAAGAMHAARAACAARQRPPLTSPFLTPYRKVHSDKASRPSLPASTLHSSRRAEHTLRTPEICLLLGLLHLRTATLRNWLESSAALSTMGVRFDSFKGHGGALWVAVEPTTSRAQRRARALFFPCLWQLPCCGLDVQYARRPGKRALLGGVRTCLDTDASPPSPPAVVKVWRSNGEPDSDTTNSEQLPWPLCRARPEYVHLHARPQLNSNGTATFQTRLAPCNRA